MSTTTEAQEQRGCWDLAAKASTHEHLCWRVRRSDMGELRWSEGAR